jgi:hypothetical protein
MPQAARLARHLLDAYSGSSPFEVDVLSLEETKLLMAALQDHGCEVTMRPFSTRLTVTCPRGFLTLLATEAPVVPATLPLKTRSVRRRQSIPA